jgi:hypothetical protein
LREWLETSRFKGSVQGFARAVGVPLKTAQDWVYGRSMPAPRNRQKVAALTGIAEFSRPAPEIALRPERLEETRRRAARMKELLAELGDHLEYFRTRSPAARDLLRKELSGGFAASVGTLLQLLFDEERLRDWMGTRRMLRRR